MNRLKKSKTNEEELEAVLKEMGLKPSEDAPYPFWQRWKCRILGPHDWVPLYRLAAGGGALIEDGAICQVCHEEMP